MFGNSPADTRMSGAGHTHDLAAMRKATGCKVICIDPRMSDTVCGQGGEWIPIRPGTDGALCAALAYEIINNGWADEEFLHTYCVGYDEETLPESAKGKNASYKDYIWATAPTQRPRRRHGPRPSRRFPSSVSSIWRGKWRSRSRATSVRATARSAIPTARSRRAHHGAPAASGPDWPTGHERRPPRGEFRHRSGHVSDGR